MSLKVFSHAAYNISRVQTENLTSINQLFDFSPIRLETKKPEDVTRKLHFCWVQGSVLKQAVPGSTLEVPGSWVQYRVAARRAFGT